MRVRLCRAYGLRADADYPVFSAIVIDGNRFEHDVVVEAGRARRRRKGRSKIYRSGHSRTPLSRDEDVPWSVPRLVVGIGASGQLPIIPGVWEEAEVRALELVVLPTSKVCELLCSIDEGEICATLHVTC